VPQPCVPAAQRTRVDLRRLAEATEVLGDRWTPLILAVVLEDPATFGSLQQAVPDISPTVLSARLRDLERQGLLLAVPYQLRPVRYRYEPTARAVSFAGALRALEASGGAEVTHEACGTTAEVRWWCPTCRAPVDARQGDLHRF